MNLTAWTIDNAIIGIVIFTALMTLFTIANHLSTIAFQGKLSLLQLEEIARALRSINDYQRGERGGWTS